MIRLDKILLAGLLLAACSKPAEKADDTSAAASGAAAPASAAAGEPSTPATDVVGSLPKLGKLDEVDFESAKKTFTDAGWKVAGTATKSAMYAMTLTLTKDDATIKLHYYRDGGSSWKKRLEKDGATIHEAGNVLVGVNVEQGNLDPKKVLDAILG